MLPGTPRADVWSGRGTGVRSWRAVARGRVASGRADSCRCTVLRVGRIAPLARERSHKILEDRKTKGTLDVKGFRVELVDFHQLRWGRECRSIERRM